MLVLVRFGPRFSKFCWSWSGSSEIFKILLVRFGPRFSEIFGPGPSWIVIFRKYLVLVRLGPRFSENIWSWSGLVLDFSFCSVLAQDSWDRTVLVHGSLRESCLLESVFLLGPSPENSRKLHGIATFRHSQAKLQTFSA